MEYDDMIFGIVVALLIMYIVYNLSKYVYNWYSRTYNIQNNEPFDIPVYNQIIRPPPEINSMITKNRNLVRSIPRMDKPVKVNLIDITEFQILSLQLAIDSGKYSKEKLDYFKSLMKDSRKHVTDYISRNEPDKINIKSFLILTGVEYIIFDYNCLELHNELNKFLNHLINRTNEKMIYSGSVQVRDGIRKQYWEYMNK